MSVEIQILRAAFEKVVANSVQQKLYNTCLPPQQGLFVDHTDVGNSGVSESVGTDGQILVKVPIDAYVVPQSQLTDFPNNTPPGATTPAGTLVAVYRLVVSGTDVSLILDDLTTDPPNPLVTGFLASAKATLQSIPGLSFGQVFTDLGLPLPTVSRAELTPEVLAIRFDPTGPVVSHLFPGQEWGIFIDAPGIVGLVQNMLSGFQVPHLTLTPRWTPIGGQPEVTVDWRFKPDLPDPLSATASGIVGVSLTLTSPVADRLRATANWTLHIDIAGTPRFLEKFAEDIAKGIIASDFDPKIIGATKLSDQSFFFDWPLPPLTFAGAKLRYASILADQSGMTIGGPVVVIVAPRDTLYFKVTPFGAPTWMGSCRALAKAGSGNPPTTIKATAAKNYATVTFSSYGTFCSATLYPPNGAAAPFLNVPPAGSAETSSSVGFTVPAVMASNITQDVKVILQTSRGVRYIDFGHPVVEIDAQGNVTNVVRWYLPDCLLMPAKQVHKLGFGSIDGRLATDFKPPPFENPNWSTLLAAGRGIEVHLVSFFGLEPGELLQSRSSSHEINVTADSEGRAFVPIFMSLSEINPAISLERVNRKSMAGKFSAESISLLRSATVAGGVENSLEETASGAALLTRTSHDRITHDVIGAGDVPVLVRLSSKRGLRSPGVDEVALNPQPLPPLFKKFSSEIPDVLEILAIPGFDHKPLAVARMNDGTAMLLQTDPAGRVRVAGSFAGPIGVISLAGSWGMGVSGAQTMLFEVNRT